MHRSKTILTALLATVSLAAGALAAGDFSGSSALRFTGEVVALGPRPPGSKAHGQLQDYIRAQVKALHCELIEDRFTAKTPRGPIPMTNIIARFPGSSGQAIVISGHYDTKWFPKLRFVGANDGGSSTGLLLELARALSGQERRHDVYLVWFDGEEAFDQWSDTDGLYGSRHLAAKWAEEGLLPAIVGLINVDMIGDKDLGILDEHYSTRSLSRIIGGVARQLGHGDRFFVRRGAVEDDHVPFLKRGVNAVDLIDFSYGPGNAYWHTEGDSMDKLSAESLDAVGDVLLAVIEKLERGD